MRKVKLTNYIILAIIILMTIMITLFMKKTYDDSKKEEKTNSILTSVYEIKENDLKSYLVENREIVIYTSYAKDKSLEPFETALNNYIVENDLTNDIVYINLDKKSSKFYEKLLKYFDTDLKNIKLLDQNNMYYVNDGKIKDILYVNNSSINIKDIDYFLKENDLILE